VTASELCLRGGLLPDRPELGPVDVLIAADKIQSIAPVGQLNARQVVDISETWLLPGVVDAHVHPIHAETFSSVGNESVLGGITTVLNHLYPNPGEHLEDAVNLATQQASRASADFGFHIRITPDRLGKPLGLAAVTAQMPSVLSVKAFLAHSNPDVECRPDQLVSIIAEATAAGLPVIVHAEFGRVIASLETVLGPAGDLQAHDQLRSAELEAACVAAVAAIAHRLDGRLYIAHLSSPEAVKAFVRARKAGTRILGETCPHYLFLDTSHRPDIDGRVTPPLRSPGQREQLKELVSAGALDVLASDHCGYDAAEKPTDDFVAAGNGLPGLDSMLAIMLDAVIDGHWLRPGALVRLLCSGPARAFGLVGKGFLVPGADADLIVVDPAGTSAALAHPPGVATAASPYGGRQLHGKIVDVLRRGEYAVRDGLATGLADGRSVIREEPTW
jgi:dihydropyrimidinase